MTSQRKGSPLLVELYNAVEKLDGSDGGLRSAFMFAPMKNVWRSEPIAAVVSILA
jgi:hypothetical protein